jgi:hypothetical protein
MTWGFTTPGHFYAPGLSGFPVPACSLLARRSDVGAGAARPLWADWSRPAIRAPSDLVTQRDSSRQQSRHQDVRPGNRSPRPRAGHLRSWLPSAALTSNPIRGLPKVHAIRGTCQVSARGSASTQPARQWAGGMPSEVSASTATREPGTQDGIMFRADPLARRRGPVRRGTAAGQTVRPQSGVSRVFAQTRFRVMPGDADAGASRVRVQGGRDDRGGVARTDDQWQRSFVMGYPVGYDGLIWDLAPIS